MYRALWRLLPGPIWVRIILALILVTAVVAALIVWAFPWALENLVPLDATVEAP